MNINFTPNAGIADISAMVTDALSQIHTSGKIAGMISFEKAPVNWKDVKSWCTPFWVHFKNGRKLEIRVYASKSPIGRRGHTWNPIRGIHNIFIWIKSGFRNVQQQIESCITKFVKHLNVCSECTRRLIHARHHKSRNRKLRPAFCCTC